MRILLSRLLVLAHAEHVHETGQGLSWLVADSVGWTIAAIAAGVAGLGWLLLRAEFTPPTVGLTTVALLLAVAGFYWWQGVPAVSSMAVGAGFALTVLIVLASLLGGKVEGEA